MAKSKGGRPPAGRDGAGKPVPTRSFPQVSARIREDARDLLGYLARLEGVSQGEMIERAVRAYAESLPAAARRTLDGMRAHDRRGA